MNKFNDPLRTNFQIPKATLNMLSEMSPAGFLLFTVDSIGNPRVHASFNSELSEIGLRSYAFKILESINQVEGMGLSDNIIQKMNEEENNEETES